MESHSATCFFFFFAIALAFFAIRGAGLQRHTYIVRVRAPENTSFVRSKDLTSWYRSFLPPIPVNLEDSRLIYTYSAAIVGFAANLTEDEVRYVEKKEGSLKVYPDRILSLLTTRTPEFLGLQQPRHGFWDANGMGRGVIIGVLDTGIKPGHPSFDDKGMPSPPPKWKGACKFEKPYCNNKLIGAKKFSQGGGEVPTDFVGHGTHTAGTAAGNFVKKANVLGNGNGTAAGMAPYAHLAVYQVCQSIGCFSSDILAGIDAAIEDGVDVLSLSLGGDSRPFDDDVIAVGAFSAMEKGVFVSCAAGNSGPMNSTLSNEAPWILTVGASSMDRKIKATVKLGNGQEVEGESAFQPADFSSKMIPLVYPIGTSLSNCNRAALSSSNVTGKMVVCDRAGPRIELGADVKEAGGVALVILNKETDGYTTLAEAHYLPASDVSYINGSKILSYINSTDKAFATISFEGTSLGTSPAPVITFFSSRGPNRESPGILKPDIIGPGLNVVAAWPSQVGPSVTNVTAMTFNIISGTSMSTPHLSGIAALIKGAHPDWSPAAIKSAIMTTADTTDRDGKPIMDETLQPASIFALGAGHVNPSKAAKPGLVYDLRADDYVPYLCGLGYTDQQVEAITHRKISCATIKNISEAELNYPSIAVSLELGNLTVNRTLTNVEEERSTYTVAIDMPKDISVSVSPKTLEFSKLKEKKSFTVSLSWNPKTTTHTEGAFRWVSSKYVVRSPIVIF